MKRFVSLSTATMLGTVLSKQNTQNHSVSMQGMRGIKQLISMSSKSPSERLAAKIVPQPPQDQAHLGQSSGAPAALGAASALW